MVIYFGETKTQIKASSKPSFAGISYVIFLFLLFQKLKTSFGKHPKGTPCFKLLNTVIAASNQTVIAISCLCLISSISDCIAHF